MENWTLPRVRRSFDYFAADVSNIKMSSLFRGLLVLLLSGGLVSARSAPAQSVNGSISGSVVFGNSAPVPNAKVTLVSRGVRTAKNELTATTDKDGHFHIHDVPPGFYSVGATAVGFVRSTVDLSTERLTASIESGKETTDFVAFMARETIVEGRVLDPDGNPATSVQVRTFTTEGNPLDTFSRADENGHFRLLVAPGRFVIAGDYEPAETDSVRTYYPGVVDRQSAISLKLDEGETIRDLEFRLRPATRVRVSGFVRDPFRTYSSYSGNAYLEPQRNASRSSQDFSPSVSVELLPGKEDPQFQFEAIKSGDYNLFVVMSEAAGRFHLGKLPITIGTSDVKDLVVVARPGVDVKGRITMQGTDLPENGTLNPVLIPILDALPQLIQTVSGFGAVTFDSRTEFTITNVPPGEYAIRLSGLPPDIAIVESRKGTTRLTRGSFSVSTDSSEPLTLTLGQAGTVSGTVVDANGRPAPMVPVLLLPEKAARLNAMDLRRAITDSSGNYQIRGVTPGNYVILSLIPSDASVLEQNEWRGYSVSVTSGGVVSMNLPFLGVVLPTP
jgi:Carboxypeptidase regulatory-like domain